MDLIQPPTRVLKTVGVFAGDTSGGRLRYNLREKIKMTVHSKLGPAELVCCPAFGIFSISAGMGTKMY